jgi:hypothetical protein
VVLSLPDRLGSLGSVMRVLLFRESASNRGVFQNNHQLVRFSKRILLIGCSSSWCVQVIALFIVAKATPQFLPPTLSTSSHLSGNEEDLIVLEAQSLADAFDQRRRKLRHCALLKKGQPCGSDSVGAG